MKQHNHESFAANFNKTLQPRKFSTANDCIIWYMVGLSDCMNLTSQLFSLKHHDFRLQQTIFVMSISYILSKEIPLETLTRL